MLYNIRHLWSFLNACSSDINTWDLFENTAILKINQICTKCREVNPKTIFETATCRWNQNKHHSELFANSSVTISTRTDEVLSSEHETNTFAFLPAIAYWRYSLRVARKTENCIIRLGAKLIKWPSSEVDLGHVVWSSRCCNRVLVNQNSATCVWLRFSSASRTQADAMCEPESVCATAVLRSPISASNKRACALLRCKRFFRS